MIAMNRYQNYKFAEYHQRPSIAGRTSRGYEQLGNTFSDWKILSLEKPYKEYFRYKTDYILQSYQNLEQKLFAGLIKVPNRQGLYVSDYKGGLLLVKLNPGALGLFYWDSFEPKSIPAKQKFAESFVQEMYRRAS